LEPVATTIAPPSTPTTQPASTDASAPQTPPTTVAPPAFEIPTPPGDPFLWEDCGERLECGWLPVPFDYSQPEGRRMELRVVRHLAPPETRIGSLLVNPGGPGSEGIWLAESAEAVYGPTLTERFDIVAWDPRGTGASDPHVDCVDEYDSYVTDDPTPDDDIELDALARAGGEFAEACERRNGPLLAHVSTQDSARDMDVIRRALGEETISYFGFSYGSELGAAWSSLFPETVRVAVLDGAVDPGVDPFSRSLQQAAGFDAAFQHFLAQCANDAACEFHSEGDPTSAFQALVEQLDDHPLIVSSDRTPVNEAVLYYAVFDAMYESDLWPVLAKGLSRARDGDGSVLLGLYDEYFQRGEDGTYSNLLDAFFAISCLDGEGAPELTRPETVAALQAAAPLLWPGFTGATPCDAWPVGRVGRVPIVVSGAPMLVVGTTGDPATPLEGSRAMAGAVGGSFLTVEANQHLGYNTNGCVNDAVEKFLVSLEPPADGLTC
jgi:pimeloyl-ACP methyl ester carboxylesterase